MPVGTNEILITQNKNGYFMENLYNIISQFVYKYGYAKNNEDETKNLMVLDNHGFCHDKELHYAERHRCDLDHDVDIFIKPKDLDVCNVKRIRLFFVDSNTSLIIPFENSFMNKDGIILTIHPLHEVPNTNGEYELSFTLDDNEFRIYSGPLLNSISRQLERIVLSFEVFDE